MRVVDGQAHLDAGTGQRGGKAARRPVIAVTAVCSLDIGPVDGIAQVAQTQPPGCHDQATIRPLPEI